MPGSGNTAIAFGAILGGAVVIDYGVKAIKAAAAAQGSGSGSGSGSSSGGAGKIIKLRNGTKPVGTQAAATAKFSAAQQTFAQELSAKTGLDINVLFSWMQNEQPPGSASAPNGKNNWLNVGATGSGFFGGDAPVWENPITAADATAQWMAGKPIGTGGYSSTGYAPASGGIQSILSTAGQSAENQIAAIQNSGWASGGEAAMFNIYHELTGK